MIPIIQKQTLTMTSQEIAALVNSRHDDVKRSIERLAERGAIELPPMAEIKTATKPLKVYQIGKRDSYVIVAQLSPEFTAALVDRWQQLEERQQFNIPQSFAEALRLAADQQEVIQHQAAQIEHQRPAVEFVGRYVESTGLMGFRQVCKLLKAKENDFRAFLVDSGIMYKLGGEWVPYAPHIDAGRFLVKTGTADNDHAFNSAKFTPKGVEWISKIWGENNGR